MKHVGRRKVYASPGDELGLFVFGAMVAGAKAEMKVSAT